MPEISEWARQLADKYMGAFPTIHDEAKYKRQRNMLAQVIDADQKLKSQPWTAASVTDLVFLSRLHIDDAERIARARNESISTEANWKAPLPELEGSFPVVLYFRKDNERQAFVRIVRDSHPNLVARQL
jgi:hypothetical protein